MSDPKNLAKRLQLVAVAPCNPVDEFQSSMRDMHFDASRIFTVAALADEP